jgi:hypothetical protein
MKILFMLTFYSGFEQSLIKRELTPSRVPTLAKLLEDFQKYKDGSKLLHFIYSGTKAEFKNYIEAS